ncbi:MAG: hypothetical protein ACLRFL_03545 [Clostridia bacterium]
MDNKKIKTNKKKSTEDLTFEEMNKLTIDFIKENNVSTLGAKKNVKKK